MNGNSKYSTKAYLKETSISYIYLPARSVIELTKFIISNDDTCMIIKRAGANRPISKANRSKIHKSLGAFIESTEKELFFDGSGQRIRRFFPCDSETATDLGRRMLSGQFKSFDDPEIQKYLEWNLFHYLKPLGMQKALHVREVLFLAKLLARDMKSVAVLKKHVEDRLWEKPDVNQLVTRYENLAGIYGMRPRAIGASEFELIRMLLRGDLSSLDDEKAINYLDAYSDRQKSILNSRPSVRNWGYSNV